MLEDQAPPVMVEVNVVLPLTQIFCVPFRVPAEVKQGLISICCVANRRLVPPDEVLRVPVLPAVFITNVAINCDQVALLPFLCKNL